MTRDEIIVDLFAGGGGASQGIFAATGRHPDVAVNHDAIAIGVHTANHPATLHHCASVWKVDPREVMPERPIGLLWASPDCRHFSRAAGGRPKWKSVRSLPGVVLTWATRRKPRVIVVENVREMLGWGPLLDDGTPCPKRIGRSFRSWVGRLRGLGYKVEWRALCAADFGAPTIRTRLFIVARCDGEPIAWPQPTHTARAGLFEQGWRPAAQCIDWSIPCPSIFTRAKPLAPATLRRVAEGVRRYVIGAAEPFIMNTDYANTRASRVFPLQDPLRTLTTQNACALVVPSLIQMGYGERAGQAPRVLDLEKPLGVVTAGGCKHALVAAFLAQHNGGVVGRPVSEPLSTIMTQASQQQLVQAEVSAEDEAGARRVAAFLMSYYGSGGQHQGLRAPLGAVTTHDRFALVTVDGVDLPIVDIGMRMLAPAELAAAQGFPSSYVLSRGADGRAITKTQQVRLIGNSVCPPIAESVVRAVLGLSIKGRLAA